MFVFKVREKRGKGERRKIRDRMTRLMITRQVYYANELCSCSNDYLLIKKVFSSYRHLKS